MSYVLYKAVDFGPAKTGLSTVGYTLAGGARVTAGVAEVGVATGVYAALVTFADTFKGSLLWDSGEVSPVFAAEEINPPAECPSAPAPYCEPAPFPASSAVGTEAIVEALENPRRVSGDAGSVEGHSLPDLIAADKYLAAKAAASTRNRGLRFTKLIPDGTVGRSHHHGSDGQFGCGCR